MNRPLMIVSGREPPAALASPIERGLADQCHRHQLDSLWIPDLYHISDSSKLWRELGEYDGRIVLLCWIHPRPALWLLRRHGIVNEEMTILNLSSFRNADAAIRAAIRAAVEAIQSAAQDDSKRRPSNNAEGTASAKTRRCNEPVSARWYPVLDGDRCINCQHCLQFCLFGVYELDADGQVEVRHPDQCKPGCPACSRICPQSAIMFPLYEKDAAIAGAPGQLVALDAAARAMFYTRTKQPCPKCGSRAGPKSATAKATKTGSPLCQECGRAEPTQGPVASPAALAERPVFDDLDALVDQLDQRMQRRR